MNLAGVVLAAGAGTRLRPLTSLLPKALCPVGNRPLVDLALDRLTSLIGDDAGSLAVNAFHHAALIRAHVAGRAHVSVEPGEARGTAGALGLLREWIDGRDVLLTNADSYLRGGLPGFAEGWDGRRCRLLCTPSAKADFTGPGGEPLQYVGACLLPWALVRTLAPTPSGLYEVLWRHGDLDLVVTPGPAVDCGTPADYLAANLLAIPGGDEVGAEAPGRVRHSLVGAGTEVLGRVENSVIGAGVRVLGRVERSVVWPGAWVGPDEHLVDVIRAGTRAAPLTVAD